MSRLFLFSFIMGLLAVALGATFWPLPEHFRYRSLIGVQPDGGRQEDFVIRWPEDRIASAGESRAALPADAVVGSAVMEDSEGRRVSAEMFRLRDASDNVIGVAGRLTGTGGAIADPGRSASNWLIVIPSRGALFLMQTDALDLTLREQPTADGAVRRAPAEAASFWTGTSPYRVTATSPRGTGRVVRGTDEFEALEGSFEEIRELEEVAEDGSTRGRIVLSTLMIQKE